MRFAAFAVTILASCATLPELPLVQPCPACPAPVVVEGACRDLPPPPAHRASPSAVREGCPEGLVCLTDGDARDLAMELHSLRDWSAGAWGLCGSDPE